MAVPLLPTHSGGAACPVCGGAECAPAPTVDHLASYPFLPGGIDPLSTRRHVIAPHRIVDAEQQRVVYGTGDRVPWPDAVKYGLVPGDDAIKAAVADFEAARANLESATSRAVDADLELAAARVGTDERSGPAAETPSDPIPDPAPPAAEPPADEKAKEKKAKKGPVEDRAKKPDEDR